MFKLNRKNALFIAFTAIAMTAMTGCAKLEVSNPRHQVELGETYTVNVEDFVDKTKTDINKVEVNIDLPEKFDKEGSYKGVLSVNGLFGKTEESIEVVCKDTTPPKFTKKMVEEIKVEQNAEGVNWESYFDTVAMSNDLQDVNFIVNGEKKVDLSKVGSYKLKVSAEDKSGNRSEKEVEVVVVASKMVQKGQGGELTPYRTGYTPISESTEKLVVEKGLKIESPIVNGKVCKKGQYSTDKKQKEYETRLKKLAEEKKRKAEEERKRKEKEKAEQERIAREQAEAEAQRQVELEWQAQQQQTYQSTPAVQNAPTTVYGGNKTQSGNTKPKTQKPKTNVNTKPQGCVASPLKENEFYSTAEVKNYASKIMDEDFFSGVNKIKSYNCWQRRDECGRVVFIVSFNYY